MTVQIEIMILFCIIGCILILIIKQYQKAQGILLSIAICSIVLLSLMPQLQQIFRTAEQIYRQSQLDGSYFSILCKAIGISYLTQFGIDICRDCGENAVATSVELCGKIVLTVLALPLFLTLAETVLEVLQA